MIEMLHTKGAAWMDDPRRPCLPRVRVKDAPAEFGAHADAWYPTAHHGANQVKRLCSGCPLETKTACLAYALDNNEEGIWAGTTDEDRKRLRAGGAA